MYINSATALLLLSALTPALASPVPARNHHNSVVRSGPSNHLATRNLLSGSSTYDKKNGGKGKTLSLLNVKLNTEDIISIIDTESVHGLGDFLLHLNVHTLDELAVKIDVDSLVVILAKLNITIGDLLDTLGCSLYDLLSKIDITLEEFLLKFNLTTLDLLLHEISIDVMVDLLVKLEVNGFLGLLHTLHIELDVFLQTVHWTFTELCVKLNLEITTVNDLFIVLGVKTLDEFHSIISLEDLKYLHVDLKLSLHEILLTLGVSFRDFCDGFKLDIHILLEIFNYDLHSLLVAGDINLNELLIQLGLDIHQLLVALKIDLGTLLLDLNLKLEELCLILDISIEDILLKLQVTSVVELFVQLNIKTLDDLPAVVEIGLWGKILVFLGISVHDFLAPLDYTVEALCVKLGLTVEVFNQVIGLDINTSIGA